MSYTNTEESRAWQRKYYAKNRERIREREREYYKKYGTIRNARRRKLGQLPGNPTGSHLSKEATLGSKNGRWKNGRTKELRVDVRFLELRLRVFRRDKYTCQKCGIRNGLGEEVGFTMHHIKEWDKYPELRFEEENCLTLCWPCHFKLHHPNSDMIVPLDWTRKGQKRWQTRHLP